MSKHMNKAREYGKNSFNLEETIKVQQERVGNVPKKLQFLHLNQNPENVTSFAAAFQRATMERKGG